VFSTASNMAFWYWLHSISAFLGYPCMTIWAFVYIHVGIVPSPIRGASCLFPIIWSLAPLQENLVRTSLNAAHRHVKSKWREISNLGGQVLSSTSTNRGFYCAVSVRGHERLTIWLVVLLFAQTVKTHLEFLPFRVNDSVFYHTSEYLSRGKLILNAIIVS